MLAQVTKELRDLIARNKHDRFFERWTELIRPDADANSTVILRQADWNGLKKQEMSGIISPSNAGLRRAQINHALLSLLGDLEPGDLLARPGQPLSGTAQPTPAADSLRDLMRRKLAALERERLLATDASTKFKLDEEIRELREKLGGG
jgi:hypothetical protein